jgi:hypothetical protein
MRQTHPIWITTKYNAALVWAEIYGKLAIHTNHWANGWNVTHIPTGLGIGSYAGQSCQLCQVRDFVEELQQFDWGF